MKLLICFGFVFCFLESICQDSLSTKGSVVDESILIEKDLGVEVEKYKKIEELFEWRPAPQELDFEQPKFNEPDLPISIDSIEVVVDNFPFPMDNDSSYHGYVKGGYGNFNSPYLNLNYSARRGDNQIGNFSFSHHSASAGVVDNEFSAFSSSQFSAKGIAMTTKHFWQAAVSYQGDKNYLYGYELKPESRNTILKKDNFFCAGVSLKSAEDYLPIQYLVDAMVKSYANNLNNNEQQLNLGINAVFQNKFNVETQFDLSSNSFIAGSRTHFRLMTYYHLLNGDFEIDAGLSINSQSGEVSDFKGVVAPMIDVTYNGIDQFVLSAKVDGGIDFRSIYEFTNQLPYLNDTLEIANTKNGLELGLGANYMISRALEISSDISVTRIDNLPMFMNDMNDRSVFSIAYISGITKCQLKLKSVYKLNPTSSIVGSLRLNNYSKTVYHLSNLELNIDGNHRINHEFSLDWGLNTISGMLAKNVNSDDVKLDAIVRLQGNLHYKVMNNLEVNFFVMKSLSKSVIRYQYYEEAGFLVKVGMSYRF